MKVPDFLQRMMTFLRRIRHLKNSIYDNKNKNPMVALPMDMIELILNKLDLMDIHSFGAVCRPWRSIVIAAKNRRRPSFLQPQLPWLMFSCWASYHHPYYHQRFFSLSDRKLMKILRPRLLKNCDHRCCGSSFGWLIMTGEKRNIFLLNPFTGIQTQLPRRAETPPWGRTHLTDCWLKDGKYISKAILLSPPTVAVANSDDCVVVVMDCFQSLSFCRLADKAWTPAVEAFPPISQQYADMIFYDGRVYAINYHGELVSVELGRIPKFTGCGIAPLLPDGEDGPLYLVKCLGELLVVIRSWRRTEDLFKIFKLDPKGRCWIRLENLGDQMLFVDYKSCISLSAVDYPSLRGNCVYFSDTIDHIDVFYLEDKSIKPIFFYCYDAFALDHPTVWFTPTSC